MNIRQKITIITLDVAIIAELCIGMRAASLDPENFTPAFCGAFFPLILPTLAAAFFLVRRFRDKPASGMPHALEEA